MARALVRFLIVPTANFRYTDASIAVNHGESTAPRALGADDVVNSRDRNWSCMMVDCFAITAHEIGAGARECRAPMIKPMSRRQRPTVGGFWFDLMRFSRSTLICSSGLIALCSLVVVPR